MAGTDYWVKRYTIQLFGLPLCRCLDGSLVIETSYYLLPMRSFYDSLKFLKLAYSRKDGA